MAAYFSIRPDNRIVGLLALMRVAALAIVVAIVVVILSLWFIPRLDGLLPSVWSKMTANAAVGIASGAVSLMARRGQYIHQKLVAEATAAFVVVLGLLTVAEYVFHTNFGIDTWLPHTQIGSYPGRPSPQTSAGFILLGICALTIEEGRNRWRLAADGVALTLVVLVLVMLGGYLYRAAGITGVSAATVLSPQTLVALLCLTFVVVADRTEHNGLFCVLINIGVGSRAVRAVLPFAIFLPLLFLFLTDYVVETGLMSAPYAHATASAAASFFFVCILSWMGWRLNILECDLREASLIDELTAIYNRRGFLFLGQQAVREAERAKTGLRLFFFDLNGLKTVNDTLGHDAGSDMLRDFSSAVSESFRKTDIVARIGGDEFAVLTIRDHGMNRENLLSQLALNAARLSCVDSRRPQPKFSVGITEFMHGSADTLDRMLARADALMYRNKAEMRTASEPSLGIALK